MIIWAIMVAGDLVGVKMDVPIESWCRVLCGHEPQWGPLIGWRGIPWAKGRRAFAGAGGGAKSLSRTTRRKEWELGPLGTSKVQFDHTWRKSDLPPFSSTGRVSRLSGSELVPYPPSTGLLRSRVAAQHVRPGLAGTCCCSRTTSHRNME